MYETNKTKLLTYPSMISFLALFLAWIAITLLLNSYFYFSVSVILIAFVCDTLDGFLARKLNQESAFGRDLDSHVDVFIYLLYPALSFYTVFGLNDFKSVTVIFLYLAAGIFRLIRFNASGSVTIGEKGHTAYIGLPVYYNLIMIPVFLALNLIKIKGFVIIADTLIVVNAVLMVIRAYFIKPKNIWPFIISVAVIAVLAAVFGMYENR